MRLALALVVAYSGIVPHAAPFSPLSVHQQICRHRLSRSGGLDRGSSTKRFNPILVTRRTLSSDDWSSFAALEDENDDRPQSRDASTPSAALYNAEDVVSPIRVPAGSQLELSEETVLGVLSACREELGTLFGYTAENRGVGITGRVDFVGLDGPAVVLRLTGRYWHQRSTVLDRVANYLQQRIPEIIDVSVEDPWQLTDEANDLM